MPRVLERAILVKCRSDHSQGQTRESSNSGQRPYPGPSSVPGDDPFLE